MLDTDINVSTGQIHMAYFARLNLRLLPMLHFD